MATAVSCGEGKISRQAKNTSELARDLGALLGSDLDLVTVDVDVEPRPVERLALREPDQRRVDVAVLATEGRVEQVVRQVPRVDERDSLRSQLGEELVHPIPEQFVLLRREVARREELGRLGVHGVASCVVATGSSIKLQD